MEKTLGPFLPPPPAFSPVEKEMNSQPITKQQQMPRRAHVRTHTHTEGRKGEREKREGGRKGGRERERERMRLKHKTKAKEVSKLSQIIQRDISRCPEGTLHPVAQ